MTKEAIIVPGTEQIPEMPTISLCGGHKGHMAIQLDLGILSKEVYTNVNCDCIGTVLKFLEEKNYLEICEKRGFDLASQVSEVLKYLWDHNTFAFEKCFECLSKTEIPEEICGPSLYDWEQFEPYTDPVNSLHLTERYIKPVQLKDFDFRLENGPICVSCKIKKISPPKVSKGGKYAQKVVLTDDGTKKTIETTFSDKCASYDNWKNRDFITVYGYYRRFPNAHLLVNQAFKSINESINEKSNSDFSNNRNVKFPGYDAWKNQVLSRDNQQCVCCGLNKHLEVHHLFGYKENPELAVNENNGVTLCKFCHDKYHSVYGLKNINPVDFIDFIKRFGVK